MEFLQDTFNHGADEDLDRLQEFVNLASAGIETARRRRRHENATRGCRWNGLPYEICQRIFELGAPKGHAIPEQGQQEDLGYPVVLSLVSKGWQAVALATPRIWSNITLIANSAMRSFKLERAELWASRAKSVPLQLHFELAIVNVPNTTEALSFLSQNLAWCGQLAIRIPSANLRTVLSILQGATPLLSRFSIDLPSFESSRGRIRMVKGTKTLAATIFANNPSRLTAARFPCHLQLHWPLSSLKDLTSLVLTHIGTTTINHILSIFASFPNLATFGLHHFKIIPQGNETDAPIFEHASLEHMDLISAPDDAVKLLTKLDLPALRSLTIELDDRDLTGSVALWSSIEGPTSKKQFPLLNTLNLGVVLPTEVFHRLLSRMGQLRKLSLPDTASIHNLVDLDGFPNGNASLLCPLLDDLTLRREDSVDPATVRDALHIIHITRKMKHLAFPSYEFSNENIMERLYREGLFVEALNADEDPSDGIYRPSPF